VVPIEEGGGGDHAVEGAPRACLDLKEEELDVAATTTGLVLTRTIVLSANFVAERITLW
jgi:hypothetical protein